MTTSTQPHVSIVTPLYNEARYLVQCIESVLGQTYQNWDYTILNNGSTDGSGDIARRYAAQDRRIRVFDGAQFLKPVANYNAALRLISPDSKYCKVVFGDDWIFPECIERMVAVAEEHPRVAVVGAYGLEGAKVIWTGLPYPSIAVPGREVGRRLLIDDLYVFGSATSVLYRADLVRSRDAFYDESNLHSDMDVCMALLKDRDFGFVHQILSYSRPQRPGTLRSISEELNTYAAGTLRIVVDHGRDYLTEEEYRACVDRALSIYYDLLTGGLVRFRSRRFWDFHKKQLSMAGVGFSRTRLALVGLSKICRAVLNPMMTVEKGLQILREARSARAGERRKVGGGE